MAKIKEFTRSECRRFRPELMSALDELAKKFGLRAELGNGRFFGENYSTKVEFHTVQDEGFVPKMERDFKENCHLWGMKPDDFGKKFVSFGNDVYTIVGGRPRATKNIIVGRNRHGKEYIFDLLTVKHGMKRVEEMA